MIVDGMGDRIRAIREIRGFSKSRMAVALGISRQTYGAYEFDQVDIPSSRLLQIADLLDVTPNDFFPHIKILGPSAATLLILQAHQSHAKAPKTLIDAQNARLQAQAIYQWRVEILSRLKDVQQAIETIHDTHRRSAAY